jgi:hypothetical protein
MSSKSRELARRCARLQSRSNILRDTLARHSQVLAQPLALADQAVAGWRWLGAHPQWVAAGVAVLVVWRPRRVFRLGARAWAGWRLWQRARRWHALMGLGLR